MSSTGIKAGENNGFATVGPGIGVVVEEGTRVYSYPIGSVVFDDVNFLGKSDDEVAAVWVPLVILSINARVMGAEIDEGLSDRVGVVKSIIR